MNIITVSNLPVYLLKETFFSNSYKVILAVAALALATLGAVWFAASKGIFKNKEVKPLNLDEPKPTTQTTIQEVSQEEQKPIVQPSAPQPQPNPTSKKFIAGTSFGSGVYEEGDMTNGQLQGLGIKSTNWSGTNIGQFKNGLLHGGKGLKCGYDQTLMCHFVAKGYFENDRLNGKGIKIFLADQMMAKPSERHCEKGQFVDDQLHGEGTRIHPGFRHLTQGGIDNRGYVAEGQFNNGEFIKGKFTYFDNEQLEGHFKKDELEGYGKRTLPNGTIEKGYFIKNELEGMGKRILANGTTEEGIFRKSILVQAKETRQNPDGSVSEGIFENNMLEGYGKITYLNGKIVEGEFFRNHLQGQAKIIEQDKTIKEGEFFYEELKSGKITKPDGTVFEGVFELFTHKWKGTITYKSGAVKEGEFKDEQLHGQGKILLNDKTVKEGLFEEDKLNGKGKIIEPDGTIKEGTFIRDKMNGLFTITYPDKTVKQVMYIFDKPQVDTKSITD